MILPSTACSRHCRPVHFHGFTLIELLAVIAIIAILAALAFPLYSRLIESSRSTQCIANLRVIFTGIQGYVQENNGEYPPARTVPNQVQNYWFAAIGPYLDEGRRFDQAKVATGPWPQNIPFACPSCEKHGWGGAGIDVGINAFQVGATTDPNPNAPRTSTLRSAVASALSTTMLVADARNPDGTGAWTVGWRIGTNSSGFSAEAIAPRHNGRANVLYFDGHVGQVTAEQLQDNDFVEKLRGPAFWR